MHNHPQGTICGETCPEQALELEPLGVQVDGEGFRQGWLARGRELNALYSAIGEAARTAGIEPTPGEPTTDLVALAMAAERRLELLEQTVAAAARATALAEKYGSAIVAISKAIDSAKRPGMAVRAVRRILAGLDL